MSGEGRVFLGEAQRGSFSANKDGQRIRVLGGGLVGKLVVAQLHELGHSVTLVDIDSKALQWATEIGVETLPQSALQTSSLDTSQADIWVNLLPGELGDKVRLPLLERGARIIDLAFTLSDPRQYDNLAKQCGATMLFDVGVAPGLSNLWVAKALELLRQNGEAAQSIEIKVGGIPQQSDSNWSYMAPFSPSDVIAEYERPARIRIDGINCQEEALSRRHIVDDEAGELEAFLTDGLRSLLDLDCPNMLEYTLRWPNHIDRFIQLRDSGALSPLRRKETLEELYQHWKFDPSRPEMTLLTVLVRGENSDWRARLYDAGESGWSSMARTTGLVTVAAVEAMVAGTIPLGVHAPEQVWQELLPLAENHLANAGVFLSSG